MICFLGFDETIQPLADEIGLRWTSDDYQFRRHGGTYFVPDEAACRAAIAAHIETVRLAKLVVPPVPKSKPKPVEPVVEAPTREIPEMIPDEPKRYNQKLWMRS